MDQIADHGMFIIGAFIQNFKYIRQVSGTLQSLVSFGISDIVFWGEVWV